MFAVGDARPAFGPMAMPCAALPQAMQCMRRPMSGQAVTGQPAMPCHHAMAHSNPPQPGESGHRFTPEMMATAVVTLLLRRYNF